MQITRSRAFLSHLSLSSIVLIFFAYLIVYRWYPAPFFEVDGGWHGLRVLFFVDIVLGPGLTLLLFKPGKPGLKFDMTMVIIFQIVALSYGMWNVYSARPSAVVFFDGKYTCLDHRATADVDVEFLRVDQQVGPVHAFLPSPRTLGEYSDFLLTGIQGGKSSIYTYMDRYENLSEANIQKMLDFKLDLNGMAENNPKWKPIWQKHQQLFADQQDDYVYFPMVCRFKKVVSVVDKSTGQVVDVLNMFVPPVELKRPYVLKKDLPRS